MIFGAASFIGKNLIKLLYKDYRLKLIMSNSFFCSDIFSIIDKSELDIEEISFNSETDFNSVLKADDIVIHLASSTNPTTSNRNIYEEISSNILASARLFDACVNKKVKKVVFISSGGTVYGRNVKCPITENAQTNPINSYGLQKLSIEKMLYVYNQSYGLKYTIVRFSNPYGPYQRPNGQLGVITTFLYKAIQGNTIQVYGDGTVVRDFIYIEDAVKAIKIIIENNCKYKIYNIGSGEGKSINTVLDIIQREFNNKLVIRYGKSRKVDVQENYLNVERYEEEFGKISTIPLVEGIERTKRFLIEYIEQMNFTENS